MSWIQDINFIDILFLLYISWLVFGSKEKKLSGEMVHLLFRVLWIIAVLHLYTHAGARLSSSFSFAPQALMQSSAFLGLFLSLGFMSSLFINFTKVFFKPGENAPVNTAGIIICRIARGVLVYSFCMYGLWVSAVPAVVKRLDSSVVYRTPVRNAAPFVYRMLTQPAGSIVPFFKPDKEVGAYVTEGYVPAGRGSGDQQGPAKQRTH